MRMALLLVAVGCGGTPDPSAPPAASSVASGVHPDSIGAARRCGEARLHARRTRPIEHWMTASAATCGEVFAEAGCREAFAAVAETPPEAKRARVRDGCREAYCSVLPEPTPAVCSSEAAADSDWLAFLDAVFARDHGAAAGSVRELTGGYARQVMGPPVIIDSSLP